MKQRKTNKLRQLLKGVKADIPIDKLRQEILNAENSEEKIKTEKPKRQRKWEKQSRLRSGLVPLTWTSLFINPSALLKSKLEIQIKLRVKNLIIKIVNHKLGIYQKIFFYKSNLGSPHLTRQEKRRKIFLFKIKLTDHHVLS